eukprot:COSAG02_NODE_910_length_16005_cov_46.458569_7_plen_201_part_00
MYVCAYAGTHRAATSDLTTKYGWVHHKWGHAVISGQSHTTVVGASNATRPWRPCPTCSRNTVLSLHLAACTTKYTTRIVVTLALKHHYAESFWRQLSLSDTCSKTYVHFYPSMPRPDRYPSMPGPDRYPLVCPDSNVLVTPGIRPYARCQGTCSFLAVCTQSYDHADTMRSNHRLHQRAEGRGQRTELIPAELSAQCARL